MNITLVKKLVQSGVMRQNTELEAKYLGVDISGRAIVPSRGTFYLTAVKINEEADTVTFVSISSVDGSKKSIAASDVLSVDGMPLERLASIYGIDASGGKIAQGKRRGRKPGKPKMATAT